MTAGTQRGKSRNAFGKCPPSQLDLESPWNGSPCLARQSAGSRLVPKRRMSSNMRALLRKSLRAAPPKRGKGVGRETKET